MGMCATHSMHINLEDLTFMNFKLLLMITDSCFWMTLPEVSWMKPYGTVS